MTSLKFTTASYIAFADEDTTAFHVCYLDIHTFPAAISSQIQLIPSSYLTHIPHSHILLNSAHSSPLCYFDFLLPSPPVSHIPSVIAYLFQVCLAASLNVPPVSSHLLDAALANGAEAGKRQLIPASSICSSSLQAKGLQEPKVKHVCLQIQQQCIAARGAAARNKFIQYCPTYLKQIGFIHPFTVLKHNSNTSRCKWTS